MEGRHCLKRNIGGALRIPRGKYGAARDDLVRGALWTVHPGAEKRGYGRSPELSSRVDYIFSSTFEGSSRLERPERRFF